MIPRGRTPAVSLLTWHSVGLNQGTLAPVGLPIGLYDWPVPLGRVPVIALRTHIDPLKLNLLSQDKFFAAAGQSPGQHEWPVPAGRIPPIMLRTHTENVKLNLQGQDAFFGLAGAPQFDWPVPKGRAHPIVLRHWDQSLTDDQIYVKPFKVDDWPVPKGRDRKSV